MSGVAKDTGDPLTLAEVLLRRALKQADASPFIAHIDLSEYHAEQLQVAAFAYVARNPARIPLLIDRYPAAGIWLIAREIADQYGENDFAIYTRVAAAFGVDDIPGYVRPKLNTAFRIGCRKLGLGVAGYTCVGFVDDYVFQAGVARRHITPLVDAFVHGEAVMGPPPDDDTERLNSWERRAGEFAHPALTRLRHILEWDETGFHAYSFMRMRRGDAPANVCERQIAEELAAADADPRRRSASISVSPVLVFVDDALAVAAPPTDAVVLRIGDRTRHIPAGGQMTLAPPWPASVGWRSVDDSDEFKQLSVLSPERCLVAFDAETGRYAGAVASDAVDRASVINATSAVLIGAAPFAVGDEVSIELGRRAYAVFVSLTAPHTATVGGRAFKLVPPNRPLITLDLPSFGRSPVGPLGGCPVSARVAFPAGRPEARLELLLEHPSLTAPRRLPVPAGDWAEIDLQGVLPTAGRAGALRLSLVVEGGARALVRATQWVWPGLSGLTDETIFDAPVRPPNLCLDTSRHVVVTTDGRVALALDETYRNATLAFDDTTGRTVCFEFARPGVVVALVSEDGRERFLNEGSTVLAGADSTDSLIIRDSTGRGALDIKGQLEPRPFGRTGVRRLSLAALTSPGPHNDIRLLPDGRRDLERTLVTVAPTMAPVSFAIERDRRRGEHIVKLQLHHPIDAVRLMATNLTDGETLLDEHALGRRPVDRPSCGLLDGFGGVGSLSIAHISIATDALPDGIWMCELETRAEGETSWAPLVSARGDGYAIGHAGRAGVADAGGRLAFLRLADRLNRCYAAECWPSLADSLVRAWETLGERLRQTEPHALLEAAARPLPVDASPTWVPLRHPIELDPRLFEAAAPEFTVFEVEGADGAEELAVLWRVAGLERVRDAAEAIPINGLFFLGFANFAQAQADPHARLRGFDFARYRQFTALDPEQRGALWRPKNGRLSAAHHAWCVTQFVERMTRIAPDGALNNGQRIPRATQLAYASLQVCRDLGLAAPEPLVARLDVASALPCFFSMCAREARYRRTDSFWRDLQARTGRPRPELLADFGLLLRLAPELFAFYLLLWELVRMTERP